MRLFCKLPRDQRAVVIAQIRKAHALGRDLPEVDLIDVAKEAWAKLAADASVQKVAEIVGSIDAATVESAVGEVANS